MKDKDHVRNGGWHGAMAFFRAALALLSSLLALRILGASNYGYVVTWMSLFVVYLSLNSNAFTVLVVRLLESGQSAHQHKYTLAINSAVAFGAMSLLLLGLILSYFYCYPFSILFGAHQLPDRFMDVVLIMGLLTSVQIFVSLQAAVIEGGGRLDLAAKAQIMGPLVIFFILAINFFLFTPMGMTDYVYTLCAGAFIDALILVLVRRNLQLPIFLTSPSLTSLRGLMQMLRAGGLLQAASLLNLFLEPVNKFLLIGFAGAPLVAAYDLAMKVLWGVQHLFASAMRVFLHIGNQGRLELGRVHVKVLVLFGGPVVLAHIAGLLFVFAVARYWSAIDIYPLVIFFSIATISNLGMIFITPLYMGLIARNEFFVVFKMHALLAMVNVVSSYLLIPRLGLTGAAIGLLFATLANVFYILSKCDLERVAMSEGAKDLAQLAKRVGTLILILSCVTIWCTLKDGSIAVLCVLFSAIILAFYFEPLTGRLVNYLFKKNNT